jgi:serine/threonine-protein kinase HipA
MVFNVMSRNCDDHTKNFAFVMHKSGEWSLSPAYDVCHAYRPGSEWVSQHALSINGKRKNITRQDLLAVGRSMNIKNAEEIIDKVSMTVSNWDNYANSVNVDDKLRDSIAKTHIIL